MAAASLYQKAPFFALPHRLAGHLIGRLLGRPVLHQLDAEQHTPAAHVADKVVAPRHRADRRLDVRFDRGGAFGQLLLQHNVDAGDASGACDRVAGMGARGEISVLDGALGDLRGGADRADRQAGAEMLRYGHDVGYRILMQMPPHLAGLAEPRLRLVHDQQHAALATVLFQ